MSVAYEGEDSKIPFDLDDCISVNFMTLKNVITFIMNKVNKNAKINQELIMANQETKKKVTELEKALMESRTDGDILRNQLNSFMTEQKKEMTRVATNSSEVEKRTNKLDEAVNDLESKLLLVGGSGGGAGADMKVFEIMIHKLRKEFRNRFITSEELDERDQVFKTELEKFTEIELSIKENMAKIDLFRKSLENTVDKKDFKYEIDKLNSNVRGLGSRLKSRPTGDAQATFEEPEIDLSSLGPLEEKFTAMEENLNALRIQIKTSEEKLKLECRDLKLNKYDYSTGKELKQTVEKLQSRIEDVDKALKTTINNHEEEIESLIIERIKPIEEDSKGHGDIILQITQRISRMEVKIENINKIALAQKNKNDGLDQEKLKNLELSLKSVTRDIDLVKRDHARKVEEIMKSIYFKCDKTDVASLETKFLDNLEDLVQSMYKKFSDKAETTENLKILDKQIKNLFELVVAKEKAVETEIKSKDEDEAMLTRKPLGGLSCASCSKKVTNLCNLQATEYFSWSKLPLRDPTDRISKVGQGFSKMLSTMKPKEMKSHLSTTDLLRDELPPEPLGTPGANEKSRNKHLSPFRTVDIAQRTARERKIKGLDKAPENPIKDDEGMYLPHIIHSSSDK